MHCRSALYDLAMGVICHACKKNSNGAVLELNNRGSETEELRSGGAIMNKLAASIMSYTRDERNCERNKKVIV